MTAKRSNQFITLDQKLECIGKFHITNSKDFKTEHYLILYGQKINLEPNSAKKQKLMIPSSTVNGQKSESSPVSNSGKVFIVSSTVDSRIAKKEVIATI